MGTVGLEISMSLDGFVAGPNDSPQNGLGDGGDALFKWYESGDVDFPLPGTDMVFKISQASADLLREGWAAQGAMVAGRRMFDIGAWGDQPPGGTPCFIVTHHPPAEWVKPGSPYTFVTDGVESAIRRAKAAAGDKNVSVASASIAQQAIKAKLLDIMQIDLAPVLLGGGVSLFGYLGVPAIALENIGVVSTPDVTHLTYRIHY
jgi:dihydrofolate reductase